jgi:hypothetical protein
MISLVNTEGMRKGLPKQAPFPVLRSP